MLVLLFKVIGQWILHERYLPIREPISVFSLLLGAEILIKTQKNEKKKWDLDFNVPLMLEPRQIF